MAKKEIGKETKLGDNIKEALRIKRMSQSDLARKMNKERQHINTWCSNSGKPNTDHLNQLASILGYSVEEIITGSFRSDIKVTKPTTEYGVLIKNEKNDIIEMIDVLASENNVSAQKKKAYTTSIMGRIDNIIKIISE